MYHHIREIDVWRRRNSYHVLMADLCLMLRTQNKQKANDEEEPQSWRSRNIYGESNRTLARSPLALSLVLAGDGPGNYCVDLAAAGHSAHHQRQNTQPHTSTNPYSQSIIMSMFGLGRPQPSSAEKIAAAEQEMDLVTDMFNK